MYKLENKIAIGCLVQFYEIDIVKDYLLSVKYSLDEIENKEDVIIDICFNNIHPNSTPTNIRYIIFR